MEGLATTGLLCLYSPNIVIISIHYTSHMREEFDLVDQWETGAFGRVVLLMGVVGFLRGCVFPKCIKYLALPYLHCPVSRCENIPAQTFSSPYFTILSATHG